MHVCVKSEDDRTDYSVHGPVFNCTVHYPRRQTEFFTLSDRSEAHVQLRLFFDRKRLEQLRDRITAILAVNESAQDYVEGSQLGLANV